MASNADDPDDEQKLKSAIWYTIGQIAEEIEEEKDISISKKFIAILAETTYKHSANIAQDVEAFAKHAKRSTIQTDDVKLYVRKVKPLYNHLEQMEQSLLEEKNDKKAAITSRKPKPKPKTKPSDTG